MKKPTILLAIFVNYVANSREKVLQMKNIFYRREQAIQMKNTFYRREQAHVFPTIPKRYFIARNTHVGNRHACSLQMEINLID